MPTYSPMNPALYRTSREQRAAWAAEGRAQATHPLDAIDNITASIPGSETLGQPLVNEGNDMLEGGPATGAGQYDEDPRLNEIINELLNPPEVFADTSRRAAEVSAGRGVAGSAAGFGTALRMTDEERLRRIAMGAGLVTTREESRNKETELGQRTRELDLRAEQIRADIALGNRTAANQEELARLQQERDEIAAELGRLQAQLQRDVATRLGTPNAAATTGQGYQGSFLSQPWDWLSGTGGI
jgi:hypothetical protein